MISPWALSEFFLVLFSTMEGSVLDSNTKFHNHYALPPSSTQILSLRNVAAPGGWGRGGVSNLRLSFLLFAGPLSLI